MTVEANCTDGTVLNIARLVACQNQPLYNRGNITFGPGIQVVYLTPEEFYDLLRQLDRTGIS